MKGKLVIGVAILVGLLAAEAWGQAKERVRLALAVPNFIGYAPVYLAKDRGFFDEFGVQAEITAYQGGAVAQQAVIAGEGDMLSYFPPGVALAVAKGFKEKVVATDQDRPYGWHVVVRAGSPIRSPRDLAGKRIGITAKGSTTDFYALWVAKQAGVQVQTIPLGGAGIIPGVKSGSVDAAIMNPPLPFIMAKAGDGRSLVDLGKTMEPNLPDVWAATQRMLDERPKVVEGSLKGLFKGIRFMQGNREESVRHIMAFIKQPRDISEALHEEVILKLPKDGMIRRADLERSLDLARLGGLKELPPIEEIFTDRFLPVRVP